MTNYGHQAIIVDHLVSADRLLRKAGTASAIERNGLAALANAHVALASALSENPHAASVVLRDRTTDVLE